MADAPPPYSLRDPRNLNPPQIAPHQPHSITTFNAFVDVTPTPFPGGLPARRPSEQTFIAPSHPSSPSPIPPISPSTGHVTDEELQKAGFVSAAPYFELRDLLDQTISSNKLYHHMAISPEARPDNLPFPQPAEKWTSRGVDTQDWLTFLNHLFPPHRAEYSSDGKGQELEADADFETRHLRLRNSRSRDQSHPLLGTRPGPSTESERQRRVRIEAVAKQWNEGFFGQRHLEVLINITDVALATVESTSRYSSSNVLQKRPPPQLEETLLHQACAKGKKSQVKELLAKGKEDIEAINKKGQTALYVSVSRNEKDIVESLLKHNADPSSRPPDSDSNIHVAVYNDRKTILKHLLAATRVGLEERNSKDETPLYVAVRRHNSCIELLLDSGANPNARPIGKESMLNVVVSADQKSIAKLLLQRGVDVEERNASGETPLFRAVSRGSSSIVKILLDHGASASARSKESAPILEAVGRGDKSIVLLLLAKKDIDVEVEDEKSQRPLYKAITRGDTSIVQQLLRKGADASRSPPGEESPLNLAVGRGNFSLTHMLLEHGADYEEKNRSGESPLFTATSRGDTSILSLLLSKKADPNSCNPAGESALQRAVNRTNVTIASILLSNGAHADLTGVSGDSALYQAVNRNNTPLTSILLGHGANPGLRSSSGQLPLERAIYLNSTSVVSLLLSRGADANDKTVTGESLRDYAERRADKTITHLIKSFLPPQPPEKDWSGQ